MATKRNYNRKGAPGPRVIEGQWTILLSDQGQIVTYAYSGIDGGPGFSTWMRVFDASDRTTRYYRRR